MSTPASTRTELRRRRSAVPRYARPARDRCAGMPTHVWTALVTIALLLVVELYARFGAVTTLDLIPVTEMFRRAFELVRDHDFVTNNLLRTVLLVGVTFAISAILGVVTAYLMVRIPLWRAALEPYLNVFYAIPTFALYPVLVVLFGTGPIPIVLLAVSFSVVVIIANAVVGFEGVPRIVEKLSSSLELSRTQHFRLVLLPSALPDILAGLKLGLGYSVIAVLASEFILSTHGLGNFVAEAYASFNTPDLYAGVVFIGVFALVANLLLGAALARFDWRRR
jgi:NitT/TauT family transport system permease protein